MVNEKSVDSYHELLESGTISKRQAQVYEAIMTLEKCTNRQIAKALSWDINRVTGRVTELREKHVVEYAGDYKDSETNRTVNLWKIK
jgi:DNA-binding MarR family transcriptional regulator|tara:strand:+ start:530 stop:790 length:261 start_codon:yes stop_codon:yes gene_type:complete